MSGTTRDRDPLFDCQLLYEALRSDMSMPEIAKMFEVARSTIHRWRTSPRFRLFCVQLEDEIFERTAIQQSDAYAKACATVVATMDAERAVVADGRVEMVPDHNARLNAARLQIEETHRCRAHRTIVSDDATTPEDERTVRADLIDRVRRAAKRDDVRQMKGN